MNFDSISDIVFHILKIITNHPLSFEYKNMQILFFWFEKKVSKPGKSDVGFKKNCIELLINEYIAFTETKWDYV